MLGVASFVCDAGSVSLVGDCDVFILLRMGFQFLQHIDYEWVFFELLADALYFFGS